MFSFASRLNRLALLVTLIFVVTFIAGCAAFGLTHAQTDGQRIVQAYGDATLADVMIPGLLSPVQVITPSTAKDVHAAADLIHSSIDAYWTAAGVQQNCIQAAKAAAAASASGGGASAPGSPPAACAGPNAAQILATINAALLKVTAFLMAHQTGGKS